MNVLQTAVFDVLTENGYCVKMDDEEGVLLIQSQFELPSGSIDLVCDADEDEALFTVSLVSSLVVPAEKIYIAMEFINRVNWMFALGHFEIDPDDGQFCFAHTQIHPDEPIPGEALLAIIRTGIDRIETFLPGLVAIIERNLHAVAALDYVTRPNDLIPPQRERYFNARIH